MPNNTEFYLVLDANILIRDFWMTGQGFSYLKNHQFLSHHPIIPEVAFLEAKNILITRAQLLLDMRRSKNQGTSSGNTQKLLRLFNLKRTPSNEKWNIKHLTTRWEHHIKKLITSFGGRIIPTPSIDMSAIVSRSIARKKPFSKGDRGFRDTLIWLSTLNLIKPEAHVSFVTENTQDFFQSDTSNPHPDLLQEAEEKLSSEWTILFHRSIDEFISRLDSDRSVSSESLRRALVSNTLSGFNLWQWLEDNLIEVLDLEDFDDARWAGFPYDAEAPSLIEIDELISLDIPRLSHLVNNTYRLYCDVAFTGYFKCDIAYENAEIVVNPNQLITKNESDDFWTDIIIRSVSTFIIRIDYDTSLKKVVSYFAKSLPHWSSYEDAIDELDYISNQYD
jgi:hypothetical protein